jgi:protein-tyrosine phosphatase
VRLKSLYSILEFIRIVVRRVRQQGLANTARWLHAVGMPWLTGRLTLRYSQVTPHVYLGPQYGQVGMETLRKAGVSATMSLRAEYDDAEYGLSFPDYSYLPIVDNTAPTIEQLDQGVAFIKRVVGDGKSVYVHCGSGVGRAPTMIAAYLIADKGMTVDEAVNQIKAIRPFIRILPPQTERLNEYAEHVRVAPPEPAELPGQPPAAETAESNTA